MKYLFLIFILPFNALASASTDCLDRATLAAQILTTFDDTFESVNKTTAEQDETDNNIIWVRIESGSPNYPNYFEYKIEVRNPEKGNCLIVLAELDNVDGKKP